MWVAMCSHKVLCGCSDRVIVVGMCCCDRKRCDGNEIGCLAWALRDYRVLHTLWGILNVGPLKVS